METTPMRLTDVKAGVPSYDVNFGNIFVARLAQMIAEMKALHYVSAGWNSGAATEQILLQPFVVQTHFEFDDSELSVWIDTGKFVGILKTAGPSVAAMLAGDDREGMLEYVRSLQEKFPKLEYTPPVDTNVYLHFWSGPTPHRGAAKRTRVIDAPTWSEIAGNYTEPVRKNLEWLVGFRPQELNGGKLILWQGVPGTGKTTAIRALARAWQDWCSFEYVLDPEVLFGGGAAYLTDVMAHGEADNGNIVSLARGVQFSDKWRMLVLEDAGELIAADAKAKTGQGLSKLLNMADGLIGQGVRLMIMITTNEDIGSLAPSVRRPGRALQSMEFVPLTAKECNEWYVRHGKDVNVKTKMPIADLYAGLTAPTEKADKVLGF